MPHSLRAKLSGLRYKGLLIDKDYQRLKNALDVVDGLQDAIAEIKTRIRVLENDLKDDRFYQGKLLGCKVCLDEIRKHTGIGEQNETD